MGILIQNFKVVEDIEKLPESIFFKWVKMWTDILILVILFTTNQICSQPVEHKNHTNPDLGNNVEEAERVQSQITNSSLNSIEAVQEEFENISKIADGDNTQTAKHLNFPIENETNTNEENAFDKKGGLNVKEENASGATQVTSMNLEENSQRQNSSEQRGPEKKPDQKVPQKKSEQSILMKKIVKGKNIQPGQTNYQTELSNLDKGGITSTSELVNKLEAEVEEVVEGVINKSMSIFQKTLLERFDSFTKDIKKLVKNDATQNQFMPASTNEHHVSNRKLQTHSLDKQISNVLPTEEKKFKNDLKPTGTNTDEDSNKKGEINDDEENVSGTTQVTMKLEENDQRQTSGNNNVNLQEVPKKAAKDNAINESQKESLELDPEVKIVKDDVKPMVTKTVSDNGSKKKGEIKVNVENVPGTTQMTKKIEENNQRQTSADNHVNLQVPRNAAEDNAINESKKESLDSEVANEPSTNSDYKTKENALLKDKVPEKKPKQASLVDNIKANFDKSTDNVMKIQPGQTNYFNVAMFIVLGIVFGIFFGMKYKSKQRNSRQYRYRNLSSHLSDTRHSDDDEEEDSELFKQFIATKLK